MSPFTYYTGQSYITDPQPYTELLEPLPSTISALCHTIQGLLIHPYEAHLYHVRIPKKRLQELDARKVSLTLARISELDSQPLTIERPPNKRFAGNCRDFATMLCAILRHQGVPARVRCGFATYFAPNYYTDHVICQYWNTGEQRWILVDAQIDNVQRHAYHVTIDTCDVPRDKFIFAGEAWRMYRAEGVDPGSFGIFPSGPAGASFIRSGLVRDLAALNKQELLCQDVWGFGEIEDEAQLFQDDLSLLDRVATITLADNDAFTELRALYENNVRLQVPPVIKCFTQNGVKMISLATQTFGEKTSREPT